MFFSEKVFEITNVNMSVQTQLVGQQEVGGDELVGCETVRGL